MSLQDTTFTSCNAVLHVGNSLNSLTDKPKPTTSKEASKNALNQISFNAVNSPQSKSFYKDKSKIKVCHCTDCVSPDDIPNHFLQELKDQIQTLQFDWNKQRNDNQVLKKHLLVAKFVINKEIGIDKGEDFDSFIKKAADENWKGRQEMIFNLQRELKELNEMVERMESEMKVTSFSARSRSTKESSLERFPDERTLYWCLELERQEVWRNAEREKQKMISSRDAMKNNLDPLIARNEDLVKEAANLRERLSTTSKSVDEGFAERLQELESRLKAQLKEKAQAIQKLGDLEQQVCRIYKSTAELKENINLEKQNLKNTETKLKSLKVYEVTLRMKSEEFTKEKYKQSSIIKKKLEEVEQNYNKIDCKSEKIIKFLENKKQNLEKLKPYLMKVCVRTIKSPNLSQRVLKNRNDESLVKREKSELSIKTLNQNPVLAYEDKLSRYKSLFKNLEQRNQDKLRILYNILNKTKDENFSLLRNQCITWKLMGDINVLRCRFKKFRKAIIHPLRKKLVKKKDSSLQLVEILEERKIILAIKKTESKFLKTLSSNIFDSKVEDYEMLEGFLTKNQNHFSKVLMKIKE